MGAVIIGTNVNYLMMEVSADGELEAWATGPDVVGDKIDRGLATELEAFAARLAGYTVRFE